jgi:hypothetical protein
VVVVAAAGNEAQNLSHPVTDDISPDWPPDTAVVRHVRNDCRVAPAELPGVVTVSASGVSTLASYSNVGPIDVTAPGGDAPQTPATTYGRGRILAGWSSTDETGTYEALAAANRAITDGGGRYVWISGTSMASPHATGVAALIRSVHPNMPAGAVAALLRSSATPLSCPSSWPADDPRQCSGAQGRRRSSAPGWSTPRARSRTRHVSGVGTRRPPHPRAHGLLATKTRKSPSGVGSRSSCSPWTDTSTKPAALEHECELVVEVVPVVEPVGLIGLELSVAPALRPHLVDDMLVQRVDLEYPRAEADLRAVRRSPALPRRGGRLGQGRTLPFQPVLPLTRVCIRHLLVEHERAARFEMVEEALERPPVTPPVASETERAAHVDRPVPAGHIELVHRLHVQVRREPFALRLLAAERDHVRRHVAAVDVETGAQVGKEKPTGPAGDVECRLPSLDEPPEVRDLVRSKLVVELRPPLGDEAVMPRSRGLSPHAGTVPHGPVPRAKV